MLSHYIVSSSIFLFSDLTVYSSDVLSSLQLREKHPYVLHFAEKFVGFHADLEVSFLTNGHDTVWSCYYRHFTFGTIGGCRQTIFVHWLLNICPSCLLVSTSLDVCQVRFENLDCKNYRCFSEEGNHLPHMFHLMSTRSKGLLQKERNIKAST